MYAVISKIPQINSMFIAVVAGDQSDALTQWLAGRSQHNSVLLEDVATIKVTSTSEVTVSGLTWVKSTVRLDRYQPVWKWSKSPSKMPPVPRPGYRSAALITNTGPTFDCVDFSDRLVPILRQHQHQDPAPSIYHVPCEVFCLANYTTRASQTHYNVVINEDDYQDPDEDDPPAPPRPPRGPDNHHGAALPIQV